MGAGAGSGNGSSSRFDTWKVDTAGATMSPPTDMDVGMSFSPSASTEIGVSNTRFLRIGIDSLQHKKDLSGFDLIICKLSRLIRQLNFQRKCEPLA